MEDAGNPGVRRIKGQVEHMFIGNYQHSLDDKGRLTVPARFRELLEGGAFVTRGFDNCLMVLTPSYFDEVYQRINAMNLADFSARMLRRLIISNAFEVSPDKVGRILVPQNLREFIHLDSEAVVAGQGEYFEIWTPATWEEQMNQFNDPEANNQRFATLDLSS